MNKNDIREHILEKKKRLDKEEVVEKGNIVKEKLFSLEEYKKAKTVMFFVSFGKEIYTHDMVDEALKHKKVIVPKIVEFELFPCVINDFSEMQPGKYRILEPVDMHRIDPAGIDVVLVPGIAFDKRGYRIGFGKGYYDSFLKGLNALKIGLCMDFQIIDKIPNDEWDVKMDMVVSEKRIIR